jgi:hypothetical protein
VLIDIGDKVHVIERRLFDGDVRRHFFGEVERVDGTAMRVTGYAFLYDVGSTRYVRSANRRTRIIPLAASGFILNVAPGDTQVDKVRYEESPDGRLTVTDGGGFRLDINEFSRLR